jgi:predicted transcriptional regulator
MSSPQGTLTPAQFEIMQAIWDAGDVPAGSGLTVAELWDRLQKQRSLGRTTVLNQVNRLASRGWLHKHDRADGVRFSAAVPRDHALASLARAFTEDYFAGSAGSLFQSLLGSADVSPDELAALRQIVQNAQKRKQEGEAKP